MLVTADVSPQLREDVSHGLRPCPEYLLLEQSHGVGLRDWGRLAGMHQRPVRAVLHALSAVPATRSAPAVLTDGEHLGLPLALALQGSRIRTPHVMLGHHLTTSSKRLLLRRTSVLSGVDRILVHADSQRDALLQLGAPPEKVFVVPYGVDTTFWAPAGRPEKTLVAAAGREHRDYETLALACHDLDVNVFITDSSNHSPQAHRREPFRWPTNVQRGTLSYPELRTLYADACVVVVPLLPTDFSAGITATLEAMSMGKAVVISGTVGLAGLIEHGRTGIVVEPQDAQALRQAVLRLLRDDRERARMGAAARAAVLQRWSLDSYSGRLAEHLYEVAQ